MKILVIIPTYNEETNIKKIVGRVLEVIDGDILVVDDNSIDATKTIVKSFNDTGRVFMLERPSKLGLGTAYINGFEWGLNRGYDLFFEMDADNSHDPAALRAFIEKIKEGYDIVVGSRYLNHTISVVGWDFERLLMSKFGNWYASTLLGIKQFTDLTSGYRCYTDQALKTIGLDRVRSNGYAFQIEMVYRCNKKGLRVAEVPIIFYERGGGLSKMSGNIVKEAVLLPFKLIVENLWLHINNRRQR
ncbi:MAG: polyprenol monophosphomannose synthase [Nitrospirae bacterium]|nr:polyprenol monophosphomannose synthase [Nitrospirota bacterium]